MISLVRVEHVSFTGTTAASQRRKPPSNKEIKLAHLPYGCSLRTHLLGSLSHDPSSGLASIFSQVNHAKVFSKSLLH
jgi:hypothetical protein